MVQTFVIARTLLLLACFLVINHRVRTRDDDRGTWRAYRNAIATLTGANVVDTWLALAGTMIGSVPLPIIIAVQVSIEVVCLFLYRGLIWGVRARQSGVPTARVDWLIGLGAACAATAGINLLLPSASTTSTAFTFSAQIHLLHLGGLLVVLATTVIVGMFGPIARTARVFAMSFTVAGVLTAQTAFLLLRPTIGLLIVVSTSWLVLALTFAAVSRLPRARSRPTRPSPLLAPLSAFAVTLSGLAFTTVGWLLPRAGAAVLGWGIVTVCIGCVRMATLLRSLVDHDRTQRQATTDDLTGLGNRRAFLLRLRAAHESGTHLAVLLLDLDRFKEVNDQYGHAMGDEVLAVTALRLRGALPEGLLSARLGGDEFAVLLTGVDAANALPLAERILRAVTDGSDTMISHRIVLSASIGVVTSSPRNTPRRAPGRGPDDSVSSQELLRRADRAMYGAKAAGGGVRLYDEEMDRTWRGRVALAEDLQAAIGRDAPPRCAAQFLVYYQPQINITTGAVVGVEALVRWQHPELGLLAPGSSLDIAEERGLMPALTSHVVRQATEDLTSWRTSGIDLRLSINTSSSYLSNPQLIELLDAAIATGTPADRLVVEVTETSLMNDPDRSLAACQDVTARGCGLSIDDFGTGYSSLAYLANLPATEVKIDRSFTSRALADERIAAIVTGTIELAQHLGLRTVAEGVEDAATLDLLRGRGCEEVQGYFYSRPLPAHELLIWLRTRGDSARTPHLPVKRT